MAGSNGKGWTLVIIPENEQTPRQIRLPRKVVFTLLACLILLISYALIETVLFWITARKAAEVDLLRLRVRELESSSDELARLAGELTELRAFEQRVRRVLSGQDKPTRQDGNGDSRPLGQGYGENGASPLAAAQNVGPTTYSATDIPTVLPVKGYLTRDFLPVNALDVDSHHGLDFAAAEGMPIVAAADGQVVFSGWSYPYGNLIVLTHRSGYVTFYGHNRVVLARAGERVRQGEPIALLGNSGVSTAPHLHFEIWRDGAPVDPTILLRNIP